jgi:hypothetical protein
MTSLALIPKAALLLAVVGGGLALFQAAVPAGAGEPAGGLRRLRHVVLFKFKDTSTPEDVARIVAGFRALPGRIKEIAGFEWGTDVSPEGKAQGFTHCFLLTFATAADRDAYLPHPAHKEFVALVGPHVDNVCVVDYWTQD